MEASRRAVTRGAQARELAILLEIRAMPTFKVFKGKQEVGAQQGWSEAEARAAPSPRRRALGQYSLPPSLWPLAPTPLTSELQCTR